MFSALLKQFDGTYNNHRSFPLHNMSAVSNELPYQLHWFPTTIPNLIDPGGTKFFVIRVDCPIGFLNLELLPNQLEKEKDPFSRMNQSAQGPFDVSMGWMQPFSTTLNSCPFLIKPICSPKQLIIIQLYIHKLIISTTLSS